MTSTVKTIYQSQTERDFIKVKNGATASMQPRVLNHILSSNFLQSLLLRHNLMGFVVVFIFVIIPAMYVENETITMVLNGVSFLYIQFMLFGTSHCKKPLMTMSESEQLYNDVSKCKLIKSINGLDGDYKGRVIAYNTIGAMAMNALMLHGWFGKSFYGNNACALILQRWIIIPTWFKWNLPILGSAILYENMSFNDGINDDRHSVAMRYVMAPITDHFRVLKASSNDEIGNGKDVLLGVMVVFGYKLMYFTLEKV